jgi:hypothetical protein
VPTDATIIARYRILSRVGGGGMGVVFLAHDPSLERLVAIKLLREDYDNAELRARFAREARSAARLNHVNIVSIYDFGDHGGQPYIAMEYVPGESLKEMIQRRAPVPLLRKLQWIQELCSGLAHAHKAGIVHRDVKPANIMISPDDVLKILDFGIARVGESSMTKSGMLVGTLNYMSPEQVTGGAVDHRSDIFAVGAVSYELLCYRQAYPGGLQDGILHKILSRDPEPIADVCPGIDPDIVRIVSRAMAKDPANRYQDLSAMRRELSRVYERHERDAREGETQIVASSVATEIVPRPGRLGGAPTDPEAEARASLAARFEAHLTDAAVQFDAGDFTAAVAACGQALQIAPADPRALELLERVRLAQDERQLAEWISEGRRQLDQGDLTVGLELAQLALQRHPDSPAAQGLYQDLEGARRDREEAARRTGMVAEALARARNMLASGALQAAVQAATEALAFDSAHSEALQLRSSAEQQLEELRRAELARRVDALVAAARASASQGDYSGALEVIGQAEALGSGSPAIARARADIEREQAKYEAAQRALREFEAALAAAERELAAGEFARAQASVERALALRTDERARALLSRIEEAAAAADRARLERERQRAAEEERRRAEEAARRHVAELETLAASVRSDLARGNAERAAQTLARLAKADPPYPDLEMLAGLGREVEAALARAEAARQRAEENKRADRALAAAEPHVAARRFDEAVAVLAAFTPPHPRVTTRLAELGELAREAREAEERRRQEEAARQAHFDAVGRLFEAARDDLRQGRHAEALEKLAQVAAARPPHPQYASQVDGLRRRAETAIEAAGEARRREEHERRAQEVIAAVAPEVQAGRYQEAISTLLQFTPVHERVGARVAEIRELARQAHEEQERQRVAREAEAREREAAEKRRIEAENARAARQRDIDAKVADAAAQLAAGDLAGCAKRLRAARAVEGDHAATGALEQRLKEAEEERQLREALAREERARAARVAAGLKKERRTRSHEAALALLRELLDIDPQNPDVATRLKEREAALGREREEREEEERRRRAVAEPVTPADPDATVVTRPPDPVVVPEPRPFVLPWPVSRREAIGGALALAASLVLVVVGLQWSRSPAPVEPPPAPPPAIVSLPVTIDAVPWARVRITPAAESGQPVEGVTPLVVQLAEGDYRVELANDAGPVSLPDVLRVRAGQENAIRVTMPGFDPDKAIDAILGQAAGTPLPAGTQ